MGCVNSKDINDTHSNIFQVANVNDSGVTISPGKLQVTDIDLVLYQRGKDPIKWPLKSLRKYGFDSDVFSFECGRRCATGEGIYAFRTRKAEQLFNLIQVKICHGHTSIDNDIGPNLQEVRTCIPLGSFRLPSQVETVANAQSVTRHTDSRPGSQIFPQLASPSPPPTSDPRFEFNNNSRVPEPSYLNLNPNRKDRLLEQRNYQNVDVLPTSVGNVEGKDVDLEPSHVYMNVDTTAESDGHEAHCYVNINTKEVESDLSVPSTPTVLTSSINYAALDLSSTNATVNSSELVPESPSKTKKGYATIDFQKTTALSQSINPSIETEEGSRKTRHNVTSRHSNSLSD